MTVREYIGARYVPVFSDPIQWDNTSSYEPLTVVMNQGTSYVSKQSVPTGIEITNETYWLRWADYNAQLEEYIRQVQTYTGSVDTINNALPISDFDENNTVKDLIDSISALLPGTDFSSLNTVKDVIDALAALLPASEFDSENTIHARFEEIESNSWVTTDRIADESVTSDKIADKTISANNMANGVLGYGNGYIAASKSQDSSNWFLYYSNDGIDFFPIRNLSDVLNPSVDDLCSLKKYGDWYYIISQYTYITKDFVTFTRLTTDNLPQSPYGAGSYYWGYDIIELNDVYYYIFCPCVDPNITVANGVGGTSRVFHVYYGTCEFDNDNGVFTFDAPVQLPQFGTTNNDSYIDPSMTYHQSHGVVLAIKNEVTSKIEIWTAPTVANLVKNTNVGYFDVGYEAPKIINVDNELILYSHCYKGYYPLQYFPVINTVQCLTKNGIFVSDGLKNRLYTRQQLRHMGVMKCDCDTYELIKNFNCIPCFNSPASLVASLTGTAGDHYLPNLPGLKTYIGGSSNARTLNMINRFNCYENGEMPIGILTTPSGINPNVTIGSGFATPIQGKKIPFNGDSQISTIILYDGNVCSCIGV